MSRVPTVVRTGRAAAALALASFLLAGCLSAAGPSETVALPLDEGRALSAVNAFRAESGLRPLTIDRRLTAAAEAQSAAMAARDKLDHAVAGRLPNRVQSFGYDWSATAENIGRGYPSHEAALSGWIGSPGHRKNLLNPRVTEVGFAGARNGTGGRLYWTQIFAAPRERTAASPERSRGPLIAGGSLRFP